MHSNHRVVAALCAAVLAAASGASSAEEGRLSNWGRWGKDDQRGAANLISPERVVEAAKLIRTGRVISLAIPLDSKGPHSPTRSSPAHLMVATGADYVAGAPTDPKMPTRFADDYIFMPLQGSTQWDALSHAWYGETLYNGVHESQVRSTGAQRLGIDNIAESMVGRGVLIDVVAYKGGRLPLGTAITRADLEGALRRQKTQVRTGDIVLVRTGFVPGFYALQDDRARYEYVRGPAQGLGEDVLPWLYERGIAGIAADNIALEVLPTQGRGLHGPVLRDLGVYIGEIWWLEDLARACAEDGRYEFFLAAQPLRIPGAVGSPLNPVAIK